nr:hypothetical protein [uncultured bacterium]
MPLCKTKIMVHIVLLLLKVTKGKNAQASPKHTKNNDGCQNTIYNAISSRNCRESK